MLRIVWNRLKSHRGLAALSLLAVVLAIGLAVSVPIFAQAVNRAILEEQMAEMSDAIERSPLSLQAYYMPRSDQPFSSEQAEATFAYLEELYARNTGLPVVGRHMAVSSSALLLKTLSASPYGEPGTFLTNASLGFISEIAAHASVANGQDWGTPSSGDVLNVWMQDDLATELGVLPGETYELHPITTASSITIRIAGTWAPLNPEEAYWPASPNSTYRTLLLVNRDEYAHIVEPHLGTMPTASVHWSLDLDQSQFIPELAERYLESFARADTEVHLMLPDAVVDVPITTVLEDYLDRLTPLRTLLLGFSVPIIGFVLYFAALVSGIAAESERQVTAIMLSRGASDEQILLLSVVEGLVFVVLGTPLGILAGLGLGRLMGATTSFMQFGAHTPLTVSLAGLDRRLVAATMLVSLLARIYPALAHRGQSVVAHTAEVSREIRRPFWQRYYVDLILVVPTIYLVRQLEQLGSLSVGKWTSTGDVFNDPTVFLVPALFILTGALVAARLVPLLLRLLDRLLSSRLPISLALTMQQLGRRGGTYTSSLLLITVTMAIGVFVSSMAQSLDDWTVDRVTYQLGGDISFQVDEGPSGITAGAQNSDEVGYVESLDPSRWLVPLEELTALPGISGATWTGRYRANMLAGDHLERAWLMAVDRQTLPSAINWRADFASESLGSLMNRLATRDNGALVSKGYLERTGLYVGDPLKTYVSTDGTNSVELDLVIVGVYELFPTVYESQVTIDDNASTRREAENLDTIIANLDYVMSMGGGVATYDIWLKTDRPLEAETLRREISAVVPYSSDYADVWTLTDEELERKERIGVYGVLTCGFVASLLLSAIGLMIQHHRALETRLWRFAALRSLGLSRGQLQVQIQIEYLAVLLLGLAAGATVGIASARIFVPFFRVTTEEGVLPLPPLSPVLDTSSIWLMAGAFAGVQIAIQSGLLHRALRSELFQILRMGARE